MYIPDIALVPLYIVLVLIPTYLFDSYVKRLRNKGYNVVTMLSVFDVGIRIPLVPTSKTDLFIVLIYYAGYVVFFEESLFRVAPFIAMGIWGLAAGSIVWGLLHDIKLYNANEKLERRILRNLIIAHSLMFTSIGVFYFIAAVVSLMYPYLFHALNNGIVVLMQYYMMNHVPKKSKFIVTSEEGIGKTGGLKAKIRIPTHNIAVTEEIFIVEKEKPRFVVE